MTRRHGCRGLLLGGAIGVALAGCGDSTGPSRHVDLALSTFAASDSVVVASGGGISITLTLTVRDGDGRPFAGRSIRMSASGTGSTLSPSSGTSDAGGEFTCTLSGTVAEAKTITATINDSRQKTLTVRVVAAPPAGAGHSSLSVTGDSGATSGNQSLTATVQLRDAFDNPATGQPIALTISGTGNTFAGPSTGVTGPLGAFTLKFGSVTAERKVIQAVSGGLQLIDTVTVTPGRISAAHSPVSSTPDTIAASTGASVAAIGLLARDSFDNALAATGVTLTLLGPAAPEVFQLTTDSAGAATLGYSSTVAGPRRPQFTVGTVAIPGESFVVAPGPVSPGTSFLQLSADSVPASQGAGGAQITVMTRDAFGNPVNGVAVSVQASGTQNVLLTPNGQTSGGAHTATLRSTLAEAKIISAQAGGAVFLDTLTIIAGPIASAIVGQDKDTLVASRGAHQLHLTVAVFDQFANPVDSAAVGFTSDGGGTFGGDSRTGQGGQQGSATVTYSDSVAGPRALTGTVDTLPLGTYPLEVIATGLDPTRSQLTAAFGGVPGAFGIPDTVMLTAADSFANPIAGVAVQFPTTLPPRQSGATLLQLDAVTSAAGTARLVLEDLAAVPAGQTDTILVAATVGGTALPLPQEVLVDAGLSYFGDPFGNQYDFTAAQYLVPQEVTLYGYDAAGVPVSLGPYGFQPLIGSGLVATIQSPEVLLVAGGVTTQATKRRKTTVKVVLEGKGMGTEQIGLEVSLQGSPLFDWTATANTQGIPPVTLHFSDTRPVIPYQGSLTLTASYQTSAGATIGGRWSEMSWISSDDLVVPGSANPGFAGNSFSADLTANAPGSVLYRLDVNTGGAPPDSLFVEALPATELATTHVVPGGPRTCAIASGGGAYCWGFDPATASNSPTPIPLPGDPGLVTLAIGRGHSCGLATGGELYCWGDNANGQLGTGTTSPSDVPVRAGGTALFRQVVVGNAHTCAITSADLLFCWGWNFYGQLGVGGPDAATPQQVPLTGVLEVVAGYAHTCARITGGAIYCWGWDGFGQLGNGSAGGGSTPSRVLTNPGNLAFSTLQAGGLHTCGVAQGAVWCWGDDSFGQLDGQPAGSLTTPTQLISGFVFQPVLALGDAHSCGLTTTGVAVCWGDNSLGQQGPTGGPGPQPIALSAVSFQDLRARESTTCGTTAGAAYCWGSDNAGQVGDGQPFSTSTFRPLPVRIVGP